MAFMSTRSSYQLSLIAMMTLAACGKDNSNTSTTEVSTQTAPLVVDAAQFYMLRSVYSGKVLDVVDNSTSNGVRLQQWDGWGGDNQLFRFVSTGGDSYAIVGKSSNKCVDLYANDPANGTKVQLWDCYTTPAQQWRLVPTSDNQYLLVHAGTQGCIDIAGPSKTNGALAQQWGCWSGASNQRFTLETSNGGGGTTGGGGGTTGGGGGGGNTGGSGVLHVAGNRLVDGAGNTVKLHGVNIPSLEWGNGEPNAGTNPCYAGQTIMDTVRKSLNEYRVNFVRLPISQDRWWNAVDGQGASYRATVDQIVQLITSSGAYVDVDLHWSDAGVWGQNIGQHNMPDDNTATVWADLAAHFKNNPNVLLGLYNEPHDVDWNTWRNGGYVNENGITYHTPGIAGLVQVVRNAGAKNVIIAGGLDWAFDLTGIANGYALPDNNLVYDAHVYPWKGNTGNWDAHISLIRGNYPLLIGEFGANYDQLTGFSSPQAFISTMKGWLDGNGFSYAAWDMHPQATPSMISDWCYTLTPYFGAVTVPWL